MRHSAIPGWSRLLLTAAIVAASWAGALAGDCPARSTLYGGAGIVNAVASSGNHVFLGGPSRYFVIVNVDDPANPWIQGMAECAGDILDIAVSGDRAYAVAGYRGLRIFDISDPSQPAEVGFLSPGTEFTGVAVAGGYAYVSDFSVGLRIIDVSVPAEPVQVAAVNLDTAPEAVTLSGDYAFVVTLHSLWIVRVNPENQPAVVGKYILPTHAYGTNVTVNGNVAYVACANRSLLLIDVGTPGEPRLLGSVQTRHWPRDVQVSNGYVFVADHYRGLCVVDVSNPAQPVIANSLDTPGLAVSLALSGGVLYLADQAFGLRVIDVSDPAHPRSVTLLNTPGDVQDIALSWPYAYVADWRRGLWTIDLRDPALPRPLSSIYTECLECDEMRLAASGTLAFLVNNERSAGDNEYSRLFIIDLTNPEQPKVISTVGLVFVTGLAAAEGYLYATFHEMASNRDGLRIVAVTDPAHPRKAGRLYLNGAGKGVAVHDGYAYVLTGDSGFTIIDVADPDAPRLAGQMDTPGETGNIAISGGTLYVTEIHHGLRLYDLGDPLVPVEVGQILLPGSSGDVAVADGFAYVSGSEGLQLIDVRAAGQPVWIGADRAVRTGRVAAAGRIGVVSQGSDGLYVLSPCTVAPADLRAAGLRSGCIGLAWLDRTGNESGFELERQMDGARSWELVAALPPDSSAWMDAGLTPDKKYWYRVRARQEGDASTWSNEAAAWVPRYDAVIPAAAHTLGDQGSEWRTDMELLNLGAADQEVELALLRANQANPEPDLARVWVPVGQTVNLADVLRTVFEGENAALGVRSGNGLVLANARFYDITAPCGENYGMSIPAVAPWRMLSGESGELAWFFPLRHGVGDRSGWRSNLGVINACGIAAELELMLYGDGGEFAGSLVELLQPYEYRQYNRIGDLLGAGEVERGYASVGLRTPEARLFCYAMVIDAGSGDSLYLEPEIQQPAAGRPGYDGGSRPGESVAADRDSRMYPGCRQLVPVAAHGAGVGRSDWRTDLALLNLGGAETPGRLALFAADQPNPEPDTVEVRLPQMRQVLLADLLGQLFGGRRGAVGIIEPTGCVRANALVYDVGTDCPGTVGAHVPGGGAETALAGDGASLGVFQQLIFPATGADGFRVNIGFTSLVDFPVEVRVMLYQGDGVPVGAITAGVDAYGHIQWTGLADWLGEPAPGPGYALVEVLTPGGLVQPYAMLVDNVTGDPEYLKMKVFLSNGR